MHSAAILASLAASLLPAPVGGVVPPIPPVAAFPLVVRVDADGHPLPPEAVRRLGTSRFLVGVTKKLLYSADGKTIYSGDPVEFQEFDNGVGSVTAWDVATGKRVWRCPDRISVTALVHSADGKTLWVGGFQSVNGKPRTVCQKVSATDGRVISTQRLSDGYATCLSVSNTGRVALRTSDGVKVFDPGKAEPILTRPKPEVIPGFHSIAIAPDGSSVVVSEAGGMDSHTPPYLLRCFALDTGEQRWEVETYPHSNLAVSPDGKTCWITFASGQRGTKAERDLPAQLAGWDMKTGGEVALFELPRSPDQIGLSLTPDGKRAVLSLNSVTTLFDTATGVKVRELPDFNYSVARAFSPDGKTLAHAGRNLSFQDAETGEVRPGSPEPDGIWTEQVRFTTDSSVVTLHRRNQSEVAYDLRTGRRRKGEDREPTPPWGVSIRGWDSGGRFTAVSGDGSLRATVAVSSDANPIPDADRGKIRISRVGREDQVVRELPAGAVVYTELVVSADGRHVLALHLSDEGVSVWDSSDVEKPKRIPAREVKDGGLVPNNQLVPSPCGRFLAVRDVCTYGGGGGWSFTVYDLPGGTEVKRFKGIGWLKHLAWSADGNRLVGGGTVYEQQKDHGMLFLGDVRAGRVSRTIRTRWQVQAVALSADGRTAAVGVGADVQLWEVESGTVRHTFTGLRSASGKYGFSPDGRLLVTDTADGTLVWDVRGELHRLAKPDAANLDRCWAALDADAPAAFVALRRLAAHPTDSLPFLKLKAAAVKPTTPERLRLVRAVEAAEWAGDADAIALLRHWAGGDGPAVLRSEADAALKRLRK